MPADVVLHGFYDYRLVALSVLIAMLSSYAALDLGGRVTASRGRLRAMWLAGGATAMGIGIWSMHYIGMLAFTLPVKVYYDWRVVGLSLLAAIIASAIALFVVSQNEMGRLSTVAGGLFMGLAIGAMHYIGMEAMQLSAMCHYSAGLVALSIGLAIVISMVALFLTFHLRADQRSLGWRKISSTLVMGSAIPVMHYTGMAAVTYRAMALAPDLSHALEISSVGIACIGGGTLTILSLVILTALFDRRFSAQSLELERSEQSYRQLVESVHVILWRGDSDGVVFRYVNHQAESILGYPVEAWTNTPGFWLDHLHPDDRAAAKSHCQAAAQGQGLQRFEHRMMASDGKAVWLMASIRLVQGENGNELVGVLSDITGRKLAQEEVRRLNDRLKTENTRMSAELEVSKRLQQMMLPQDEDLRGLANLDVAGCMEPASEVGGDYYDVIEKDGGVFFGIGDVTGHGLKSGVIAIMVQTAVRTLLACGEHNREKFFAVLNRVILDNARRMKCDGNLSFSLLHYKDGLVTVSGQHEQLIVARHDGSIERHDTLDLGFQLGLEEEIAGFLNETRIPLNNGDVMVAYTDGITEASDSAGFAYGLGRLAEAVRANRDRPAGSVRNAVLASLREHTGGEELTDDVSLVVIKPGGAVFGAAG